MAGIFFARVLVISRLPFCFFSGIMHVLRRFFGNVSKRMGTIYWLIFDVDGAEKLRLLLKTSKNLDGY